jgi:hypothetical protein
VVAQAALDQAAKCTKIRLAPISRSRRRLLGCSTKTTGVLNKNYRGPQQKLPGSSTKTTGVLNKNYRGPQQVIKKFILQSCKFFASDGVSLYCYVLYVVVNNNRNRKGRG